MHATQSCGAMSCASLSRGCTDAHDLSAPPIARGPLDEGPGLGQARVISDQQQPAETCGRSDAHDASEPGQLAHEMAEIAAARGAGYMKSEFNGRNAHFYGSSQECFER